MNTYSFESIAEYTNAQVKANIEKFERNWVTDVEIGIICNWLAANLPKPSFIICHGARNGYEIMKFGKFLGRGIRVMGTDISPTANEVPDMIQWDFHEINHEWVGKADLVYSNSLDHSYNPEKALRAWVDSLKDDGHLLVHWTPGHDKGDLKPSDCFHASEDEYCKMLWGVGTVVAKIPILILKGGTCFVVGKK